MNDPTGPANELIDVPASVRTKLSALWVSTMFCYVYGDYFELYVPGKLTSMLAGRMEPLGPTTPAVLLGTSVLMAIPAVMVILTLVLRPAASRWLNMVAGVIYSLIMLLVIRGGWSFYVLMGIIEIVLTSAIVAVAWKWPRRGAV
jgi:Family of unknown function (DUF6326)